MRSILSDRNQQELSERYPLKGRNLAPVPCASRLLRFLIECRPRRHFLRERQNFRISRSRHTIVGRVAVAIFAQRLEFPAGLVAAGNPAPRTAAEGAALAPFLAAD